MLSLVLIALVSQARPGPLDAFRANHAAIQVDLDYVWSQGRLEGPSDQVWTAGGVVFTEAREGQVIEGHWACDGESETNYFRASDEVYERARKALPSVRREAGKRLFNAQYVPETETLWDGRFLCSHKRDPVFHPAGDDSAWSVIECWDTARTRAEQVGARGPFRWNGLRDFEETLRFRYSNVTPETRRETVGGTPLEVEVYRVRLGDDAQSRYEVGYDPAIGYVPRFVRTVEITPRGAVAVEYLVAKAEPCAAGGFVPTEWYTRRFTMPGHARRFPQDDGSQFVNYGESSGATRFRATSLRDRKEPVALTHLDGVRVLSTIGTRKSVPANRKALPRNLIKATLGSGLTHPQAPPMLNLDYDEAHKFDAPPAGNRGWVAFAGLAVASLIGLVVLRGRARTLAALVMVVGLSGCGHEDDGPARLAVRFRDDTAYLAPHDIELPMTLLIRNDSGRPIRLLKVSGGCTCREVDDRGLPANLAPGKQLGLRVTLRPDRVTAPRQALFEVATNRGDIEVKAPYFAILSHEVSPESPAHTGLVGDAGWEFEFTHRAKLPLPTRLLGFPGRVDGREEVLSDGRDGGETRVFLHRDYLSGQTDRFLVGIEEVVHQAVRWR